MVYLQDGSTWEYGVRKSFLTDGYLFSDENDCTVIYLSQGLVQLFYHMLKRDTLYITEEKLLGKNYGY